MYNSSLAEETEGSVLSLLLGGSCFSADMVTYISGVQVEKHIFLCENLTFNWISRFLFIDVDQKLWVKDKNFS